LPRLSALLRFQNDINRLDDFLGWILFAIDDDVMNSLFGARHVDGVLLCQPVVPAAVPDTQKVGVFLKGASVTACKFRPGISRIFPREPEACLIAPSNARPLRSSSSKTLAKRRLPSISNSPFANEALSLRKKRASHATLCGK
jgi:hypothetical protein